MKVLLLSALLIGFALGAPANSAVFVVNTTADQVDAAPGDGACLSATAQCSLRAAVMETNSLGGADTIQLPPGVYPLDLVGADEDVSQVGDLDLLDDLTILGLGAREDTVIQSDITQTLDRVFHSSPGTSIRLERLTVTGGYVPSNAAGGGGNILAEGELTLSNVVVHDGGVSSGGGGGLNSTGDLLIEDSLFLDNFSPFQSVAAIEHSGTLLEITNSEFRGNTTRGSVLRTSASTFHLSDSLFLGNSAETNPIVSTAGSTQITASRFRSNVGIAIASGGSLVMFEVEITNNCGLSLSNGGTLVAEELRIEGSSGDCYDAQTGAIQNGGDATIIRSVIRNSGTFNPQGKTIAVILTTGSLRVHETEISGNSSTRGGGAITGDVAEIINSTISGNRLMDSNGSGGAIAGNVGRVVNSTITDNEAVDGPGGGISGDVAYMKGTILAGNRAAGGSDCDGSITSAGFNIIGTGDGCSITATLSDLVGSDLAPVDPLLASLADNGGGTRTHRPLVGSPAVNAMPEPDCTYQDAAGTQVQIERDQRGYQRPVQEACEIGAFEGPAQRHAPSCGLGPELALLLPVLIAARGRARNR